MIADCLRSLLALDHSDLRVIVVDQSRDDSTRLAVEMVANGDPRVCLLSTESVGSSAARNLGARAAATDVVAFTDDDCVVEPGWLRAVLGEFKEPGVAAVFGRVLPAEGGARTGAEVAFKPEKERANFVGRVLPWYVGHGANMAVRLSDLLQAGGFDLLLGSGAVFPGCGDIDLIYRLLTAGRRVVYTGDALVFHKQWRCWRERLRTERNYGVGVGALCAKYLRCRDLYGLRMLASWIWQLGVRRVGAGLLKWRSPRPVYLGLCQLVFPWVGVVRSLHWPIDRRMALYVEPDARCSGQRAQ